MIEQDPDTFFCKTESIKDRIKMLKENALRKDQLTKGETQLEKLRKNNPNYGVPVEGSKTAARGHLAHQRVAEEVRGLCQIIKEYGKPCNDGTYFIFFGELFQIYTRISDKLVGLLLRARKYNFVEFIGETLFQRQDDFIPIRLISMPDRDFKFDY